MHEGYLVVSAPWYVDDVVEELNEDPLGCLVWGIAAAVDGIVSVV